METKNLRTIGFSYTYSYIKHENQMYNPIFIINGAFQNMKSWTHLVGLLKDKYPIVLADLPGWGQSDMLPSIYEFDIYNQFIMDIMEKENIEKINILSSSFGTLIGTSFAKSYTDLVDSLILCSPILKIKKSLKSNYDEMHKIIESRDSIALSKFLCKIGLLNCEAGHKGKIDSFDLLYKKFVANISRIDANHLGKFIVNTDRIMKFPDKDLKRLSNKKILILSGIHDEFTSPKDCKKIANKLNNCKLELIPRADHMFLYEQPFRSVKAIHSFLKQKNSVKVEQIKVYS